MYSRHHTLALIALTGASLVGASPAHGRSMLSRGYDGDHCPHVEPGFPIELVAAQAQIVSTHSWEYGTAAEALLELYSPSLSVFGSNPFPWGSIPVVPVDSTPSLLYAHPLIRTNDTTFIDGAGASGDPAALGVSAIMIGQSEPAYMAASDRQADHLLYTVPRFWNGAISQREDVPELWADFMYMAPPFLAYYAVATGDQELLEEVVRQCGLYRQVLRHNTTASYAGVWEHIIGPQSAELGLWSTGNGWAAAGMARVLATVKHWDQCRKSEQLAATLEGYIKEILDGARGADRNDDGLLRNYLNDTTWFGEISGTALLTAVTYRVAVLAPHTFDSSYVAWADENRFTLSAHVNASTGIASPAVNPLGWGDRNKFVTGSPEGQSFVVLMYAAYRDCVCAGVCTARDPPATPPAASSSASPSSSATPTESTSAGASSSVAPTGSSSASASSTAVPSESTSSALSPTAAPSGSTSDSVSSSAAPTASTSAVASSSSDASSSVASHSVPATSTIA